MPEPPPTERTGTDTRVSLSPGGRPHVFLSYASTDADRVLAVAAELERAGVTVWLDRSGIPGGTNYGPEIVAAIRGSDAVMLCCSAAAFASPNVRQEVALAWKHERSILPLLLEPAEIPDDLAYWLEAAQWVEVLDRVDEAWLPEVMRALVRLGVSIVPPSPVPSSPPARGPVTLPTPLTALLGRDAEVAEVANLLASHRLVTLTGPGGVGKTRLAIEAAKAVTFTDGVSFVDLAPVHDPALVLPTVAQALGVREAGTTLISDGLATAIGDGHVLVVLDNLEQVLDAAPEIAALLSRCPRLAMLATSRAALAVRGEQVVPVEPLVVPEGTTAMPFADVANVPAVAIFVARAAEASRGFELTAENVGVVRAICARLDGLPLAIELAAARVKVLPLAALLARLDRTLPTLTGGARDLPDRQRTMHNTIAWSYDLLPVDEQRLFRCLAVFVGGFTLEAAEAIAGLGDGASPDSVLSPQLSVLDGVSSLVEKSLLRRTGGSGGKEADSPRFAMLETVREYALRQLEASGEDGAMRQRHATWCLALAEWAVPVLRSRGSRLREGLDRLEADHPNLRAALAWGLSDVGEPDTALGLAGALHWFWYFRGHVAEGGGWLERALEDNAVARAPIPLPIRLRALTGAGAFAHYRGDGARAVALLEEAAALAAAVGDPWYRGYALHGLGFVAKDEGRWADSVPLHTEALALFEEVGDRANAALVRWHLGKAEFGRGDLARARALLDESLTRFRAVGDAWGSALALYSLALVACAEGDLTDAARRCGESLDLTRTVEARDSINNVLGAAATVAAAGGLDRQAAGLFGAATGLSVDLGSHVRLPDRSVYEAAEAATRAALGEVAFAEAWARGRALSSEAAFAEAEAVLADVERTAEDRGAGGLGAPAATAELTPPERTVLRLLVEGRTDQEIAEGLSIGTATAQIHVADVLTKLGVSVRAEATAVAIRRGLL